MLLTLTPNPSMDLLFEADRLAWDDANRVEAPRRRPGGQGINVARAVRVLGGRAVAVAPLGGRVGREVEEVLEAEGTPLRRVGVAGETRVFVGVVERATGRSLLVNPRGPTLSEAACRALEEAVVEALEAERPAWLACCGSVPPGVPPDLYARLGRFARERGVRFVPDCDGELLRLAADAGCDLVVPNRHEAGRLLGAPVDDVASAIRAAEALLRFGPAFAAITLGEEGAVAATAGGIWHASGPRIREGSAVGAGDAFLAALLVALEGGAEPPEALRAGVGAGAAVLLSRGSELLRREDAEAVAREVRVRRVG
ncbi:MAG TPA: hexose kinase [Longimicrobiales bacterium]